MDQMDMSRMPGTLYLGLPRLKTIFQVLLKNLTKLAGHIHQDTLRKVDQLDFSKNVVLGRFLADF